MDRIEIIHLQYCSLSYYILGNGTSIVEHLIFTFANCELCFDCVVFSLAITICFGRIDCKCVDIEKDNKESRIIDGVLAKPGEFKSQVAVSGCARE